MAADWHSGQGGERGQSKGGLSVRRGQAGDNPHEQRNTDATARALRVEPDLKDEIKPGAAAHPASGHPEQIRSDLVCFDEWQERLGKRWLREFEQPG